jgi:hypothetical protein
MASRTSISGLLLESVEGWAFSVRDGVIAGRRRQEPGVFRIMTIEPNRLPQPLSHEDCLRFAEERVGKPEGAVFDRHMMQSITGPFGSASYRRGKDLICVWYCNRPAGLILGAYASPAELCRTPRYNLVRAQCARMIATAMFDRPAWGGEDELTKYLIAELAAEEPPDVGRPLPPPAKPPDQSARPGRGRKGGRL